MVRRFMALSLFMAFLTAAAVPVGAQDPTADDLQKQIDALKKQIGELQQERDRLTRDNQNLQKVVTALRGLSEESARELLDLRQRLRDSGGVVPPDNNSNGGATGKPEPATPSSGPSSTAPPPQPGPTEVLRGEVIGQDAEFGYVLINKAEKDGVKIGYRFDINRRERDGWRRLGVGEVEKFIGPDKTQSKLKVVEGLTQEMRPGDEAVAQRHIEAAPPKPADPTAPAPGENKFAITGRAGANYMLNYGARAGARQTDRVYVYREKVKRAELRLDVVQNDWAVAALIEGTNNNGDFGVGDEVLLKEVKNPIVGRVKWNNAKQGIMIDAGTRLGVKPKMQFEVRRQGRKIGVLSVKRAMIDASECEPVGDLKPEDVYVEDFVESQE